MRTSSRWLRGGDAGAAPKGGFSLDFRWPNLHFSPPKRHLNAHRTLRSGQTIRSLAMAGLLAAPSAFPAEPPAAGPEPPGPTATVRSFNGSPSILRASRWYPLQVGEKIPTGGTVRTGSTDTLDCALEEPGRVLSFGRNSLATLDLAAGLVALESGEMTAAIRKSRNGGAGLTVRAPFGVTVVRAGDFRVTAGPEPAIAVLDGLAEFQPAGAGPDGTVSLRDEAVWSANGDQNTPQKMDAQTRRFLIGRIDSLASFQDPLALNFPPREHGSACHTPPVPALANPELRPGRTKGFSGMADPSSSQSAELAGSTPGQTLALRAAANCPIHSRRGERPDPTVEGNRLAIPLLMDLPEIEE